MSFDALAWAAKCRIPRSADKLVLLGLAEHSHRQTEVAFPSIDALIEFSSLNRKTVITALGRLETAGLISDSGERCGRTRQIKVYRVHVGRSPKTEQSQNRNHSDFSAEESQKRDTEPVREPLPPSEAIASAAPSGATSADQFDLLGASPQPKPKNSRKCQPKTAARKPRVSNRLPEDWTPPPITDLPLTTQAVLKQWPSGAYEFVATGFASHWTAESGARASKRDWRAAWIKWLGGESARVMAIARNGIKFAEAIATLTDPAAPEDIARLQRCEDRNVAALRGRLRADLGERAYDGWLKPTSIGISRNGQGWYVNVICQSRFMCDWIEKNFFPTINALAAKVLETSDVRVFCEDVTDR